MLSTMRSRLPSWLTICARWCCGWWWGWCAAAAAAGGAAITAAGAAAPTTGARSVSTDPRGDPPAAEPAREWREMDPPGPTTPDRLLRCRRLCPSTLCVWIFMWGLFSRIPASKRDCVGVVACTGVAAAELGGEPMTARVDEGVSAPVAEGVNVSSVKRDTGVRLSTGSSPAAGAPVARTVGVAAAAVGTSGWFDVGATAGCAAGCSTGTAVAADGAAAAGDSAVGAPVPIAGRGPSSRSRDVKSAAPAAPAPAPASPAPTSGALLCSSFWSSYCSAEIGCSTTGCGADSLERCAMSCMAGVTPGAPAATVGPAVATSSVAALPAASWAGSSARGAPSTPVVSGFESSMCGTVG
ncbi:hypothetical protein DMC30DRAFT_386781 [Rhodotorula diobovata]|uniref:Uncharacterized protein n=1 Tax=Rhodotorula diobovata TaxID=5288 RepID=A0A5C5G648_9BASI|nr:hypothetical protein DMC30DRAFT_386781 [Rhodotorula diobovata]